MLALGRVNVVPFLGVLTCWFTLAQGLAFHNKTSGFYMPKEREPGLWY